MEPVEKPSAPTSPCTVLVADDDDDMRLAIAELLMDEGWNVHEAGDGLEAFEKMMDGRFDVVILDNRMPKLTGSEAYRRLLAHGKAAPVLLVTAAAEAASLAASLGIEHYLSKPFELEDLVASMKRLAPGCPGSSGQAITGCRAPG